MNLHLYKNILFDIDGTLFDTKTFYSDFYKNIIAQYQLDEIKVNEIRESYYHTLSDRTDFNYENFILHFSTNLNINVEELEELFLNEKVFNDNLFPDVLPALEKLKKNFRLGIFSQGYKEYQMLKLNKTGLIQYFDPELMYIYKRKLTKDVLNIIPALSLIVDDKREVVKFLKQKNFEGVLLDRNEENIQFTPRIISMDELGQVAV